ncbi:MAG: hypothetical protein IKR92_02410 [Alphaproteobacteria bacterium]|nr:hypothetical protein [Alphaproteobacteria bacterium]
MAKKKMTAAYSFAESFEMLNKLQQMAIDEGNISLALKAEELKCKIAALQADKENHLTNENLTGILVDFINEEQSNSKNSESIRAADKAKEKV